MPVNRQEETGATGNLTFDRETRTKILNTTYMAWVLDSFYDDGTQVVSRAQPVIYLSTSGSATDASVNNFWLLDKQHEQTFEDKYLNIELPTVGDYWAVVVSPSTTWSNYRHQADAFARTFRKEVNKNKGIVIYDLYKELAKTTTGSHVTIYNNDSYGSVYRETMQEFFPE